ncbi:hypothetical protein K438DRAFT_1619282 [Mycena galopus ATCC 62051]|nr:hypothetical protein K438DRAFT_1619282 [Mycena galopus ATCC 62051]
MSAPPKSGGKRTVPMEVLGLGFCRTGTESLKIALESLGYIRTNHGYTVNTRPNEIDMWIAAIKAKYHGEGTPFGREEWDVLLGDCRAVADMPHLLFAEELVAAYPDAKIVLTMRDTNSWWKSYHSTIFPILAPISFHRFFAWIDAGGEGKVHDLHRPAFEIFFKTDNVTEEVAKRRFEEYYDMVRGLVHKERLLEFDVKEGWAPLCTFLGKDIPTGVFPKANNKDEFNTRRIIRYAIALRGKAIKVLGPFLGVAFVAMGFGMYFRRRGHPARW